MTRATMRGILRRRLNETSADNWQDTDLDDLLNVALHRTQRLVQIVDPLAFVFIDTIDLVSGQNYYPKPQGFWYESEVAIKDSSAATGYRPLVKRPYSIARDSSTGSDQVYSHMGRFLVLFPAPSAALAAGLQLIYVPTLSMATDTDVPDLHLSLHMAVVVEAQLLAIGETKDSMEDVRKERDDLVADIPLYYQEGTATSPERLYIDAASIGK